MELLVLINMKLFVFKRIYRWSKVIEPVISSVSYHDCRRFASVDLPAYSAFTIARNGEFRCLLVSFRAHHV